MALCSPTRGPVERRVLRLKRIVLLMALTSLLSASMSLAAFAHPPKSVNLSWKAEGNLYVNVAHSVNDPAKHYIYKILIYVNGTIAAQREYSSQASSDGLTDVFSLGSMPSGTKIKAEAYCVIMGSSSGTISVP